MKKMLLMLGAILFASAIISGAVFASGYNYDNSVSFLRMPARAATISSADSIFYNPVGLVKLEDGIYTELGNTFNMPKVGVKYGNANYHTDTPTLFGLHGGLVYKKDKGAIFFSNYVPAGTGMSDYKSPYGLQILNFIENNGKLYDPLIPNSIHQYEFWLTFAFGGSYALNDWLAFTGGVKANVYFNEKAVGWMKLGSYVKTTDRNVGANGFIGFMITPSKTFSITALYNSECIARGKETDKKLHYSKISEARLPQYALVGVNIKPAEKVEIQLSYQLTFMQQQNYANSRIAYDPATGELKREFGYAGQFTPTLGTNIQDYKGKLAHEVGIGAEFRVTEKLLLSLGVAYHRSWLYARAQNPLDPKLDSIQAGAGFKYKLTDRMEFEAGAYKVSCFTQKMYYGLITMNESLWSVGANISSKF